MIAPRALARAARHPAASRAAHPAGTGVTAREVDEVGLADRLDRGGVVALGDVAHEDRLDLRPERREVLDAHLRPGPERVLAIERGRRRQDHDTRPRTAGRLEESSIELQHRGKELTGAHERHGTGHGRSIEQGRIRDPDGPGAPRRTAELGRSRRS